LVKENEITVHKLVSYVGKDGLATLQCPQCGATKSVDTTNKDYAFKAFKAKCKCGAQIRGQFEFRQYYRKKVSLAGMYRHRKNGVRGKIIVENLSLMGLGFACLRKHDFQKGDQLDITFTLDNNNRTSITLWVVVENLQDRFVGARRQDLHVGQPDLGFYLK
jgi:hypothetical protein